MWLPLTYEENQWRHEVTLGGWAILSPPGALFETRERKKRRGGGERERKICPAGGLFF